MPITLLDEILVGFTLVSAMLAMVRGFSRERSCRSPRGCGGGVLVFFYPNVLPYVQPYIDNDKIAMAAAAGVVFVAALIVVTLITMRIADFVGILRGSARSTATLGFLYGRGRRVPGGSARRAAVLRLAGRRPPASMGHDAQVAPVAEIDRRQGPEPAAGRSGKLDPQAAGAERAATSRLRRRKPAPRRRLPRRRPPMRQRRRRAAEGGRHD